MTALSPSRELTSRRAPNLRELDLLMLVTVALCCLGLVMAVSVRGSQVDVGPLQVMRQQGAKLLFGLVAFLFCAVVPMRVLRKLAMPAFAAGVIGCLLPLLSSDVNGAHRWVRYGGYQFQPVEPARFALILAMSWLLARAGSKVKTFWQGFAPAMGCAVMLAGALALQPDNGNAMIVLGLSGALALVAGVRVVNFLPVVLVAVVGFVTIALQHGYVRDRVTGFLSPDPRGQVGLGLIAVGSGGLFGRGLGQGWMKMGFVPEAHNDFVFAIVAEEFGYVGSLFVLASFSLFGYVCYRLVLQIRDPFLRNVVCGYSVMICMQAALNLLVVSGWAPAKGIDLPFVSTGGTSLVFCLAAVGLIGNAARADRAGTFSTAAEVEAG